MFMNMQFTPILQTFWNRCGFSCEMVQKTRLPAYLSILALLPALFAQPLYLPAQTPDLQVTTALEYLRAQGTKWGLQPEDLQDLWVSDRYTSNHNGVTHIYFRQRLSGTPVFNAVTSVHLNREGQVIYSENRFWSQLAKRASSTIPRIQAVAALQETAEHLGLPTIAPLVLPRSGSSNGFRLKHPALSRSEIPLELVYVPQPDSTLRLAWQIGIHDPRNTDYWTVFVDASSGQVLEKNNRTLSCNFGSTPHRHDASPAVPIVQHYPVFSGLRDQAVYHVFPFPVESPIHGERKIVVNPADPLASPFGWHDINGVAGPEFTTTQGNNSFTFLDRDSDDQSDGILPDAGPELIFDYPFSPSVEPVEQPAVVLTQLFYATNYLHDFSYHYGFNEAAGNFQTNNYGRGGKERDAVLSQAQDGSGANNANFLTLPDGDPGAMQMYLWTPSNASFLQVNSPAEIAGPVLVGTAGFGPLITTKALKAAVVEVQDSLGLSLACSAIRNRSAINGKIALITRGTCTFKSKVLEAEKAGAIAVIIANNQDQILTMGNDNTSAKPKIPAILIPSSDAERIRAQLASGKVVEATIAYQGEGPALRDGSFDNGVVAHEYAHGISNRLTGGPSNADCLFNDEAMGEGWSDFFTLITTVLPGQTGQEAKGIGNYSARNAPNGKGIRRQPYSTDFSINNQVYNDIIGTRPATATTRVPHPVGEVWAAALWDLYWAMSNKYGWDPDLIKGKGGNNKAVQLVMDGMKLQPCSPGFIDGRNAILLADQINNKGENQCLIWEVFARRGLGWRAEQGSVQDRNDGLQDFSLPPNCSNALVLEKQSTPGIQAGQAFEVRLTLTNHKRSPLTQITLQDILPPRATLAPGTINGATLVRQTKDTLVFDIGDLGPGMSRIIRYTLQSNPSELSTRRFFDDFEQGTAQWDTQAVSGTDGWILSSASASPGRFCWAIPSSPRENHHILQLLNPILVEGKQPVLRFFHKHHTQTTYDGGIVEISTDRGTSWAPIPDSLLFRRPYTRPLFNSVFGVAALKGFTGQSDVAFQPTFINLRPFTGKSILFRFRFATDKEEGARPTTLPGWLVDNIELLDAFNYASTACATAKEGDKSCSTTSEWGTIVEPSLATPAVEPSQVKGYRIFPNPSTDLLYLQLPEDISGPHFLKLIASDGRTVRALSRNGYPGETLSVPVAGLSPGIYVLLVCSEAGNYSSKVVIGK